MSSSARLRAAASVLAGALVGLAGACARPGSPPGGPEDRRPPVVVRTEPDAFEVLDEPPRTVRFHFDERISQRVSGGGANDAVLVSPRTGDVRVSTGRQAVSVEVDGGFLPGLTYRVTLQPVVSDLFSNQLRDPFELVFSTGGTLNPSAVAGQVWDRITGRGVDAMEVLAITATDDSTVYLARTDTGGIYAFRYLPDGRYRLVAYQDRDRDREVDPMELQGSRTLLVASDTLFIDVAVLQPDTTAANLVRATPLDSVTVVMEFDDYLDATLPVGQMSVSLTHDSLEAPGVSRLFHEHEYVAWVEEVTDSFARLDSIDNAVLIAEAVAAAEVRLAADTAPADTAAVGDTTGAPAPVPPTRRPPPALDAAGRPGAPPAAPSGLSRPGPGLARPGTERGSPDGNPLPARRVVVLLQGGFLVPNQSYQLVVSSVVNINRVPLGGGGAAVVLTPPPPPDTAVADSAALDTLAADSLPADSLRPDTVPPDTVRLDTIRGPRPAARVSYGVRRFLRGSGG